MTDAQAKAHTLAILRSQRDIVLDHVYSYLWMTLYAEAANYLSATGNLTTTKPTSSIRCELINLLLNSQMDPDPLIVRRAGKRRVRINYKGLYLHEHVRRRGFFNSQRRI